MTMLPKKKATKGFEFPQYPEEMNKLPNLLLFCENEEKFIFEKSYELLNELQNKIHFFLTNENNYFDVHKSFPEKILKDLIYLKDYQKNISQKEEKYKLMEQNYANLSKQIGNQDSLIKQIENSYLDKISDLKMEISNLNEMVAKYKYENKLLIEQTSNEKNDLSIKLEYEAEVD